MKVLVTGANGFVGKNLVYALENVKTGKNRIRPALTIDEIMCFDKDDDISELDKFCQRADFVFNLAGVNRPREKSEFSGNYDFAETLLGFLEKCKNTCPVMLASSIQASLEGRYAGSEYGLSKKKGEQVFFEYGKKTGAKTLVYRFPNLFGKWCKPNYNSVIATFCHNIAHGLPITVNDAEARLSLAYIDDVVAEMLNALEGKERREGDFCAVLPVYEATLQKIVDLLYSFDGYANSREMPLVEPDGFSSKLYSTYISYLPGEKMKVPLKMNCDERGSFTELMRMGGHGQFSVNISKPGITKGNHWHDSKWEYFIVVSGEALIRQRKVDEDKVKEFRVSGKKIEAVCMIPGYTHEIINLSQSENLVTVMWTNQCFDPARPDTFAEQVVKESK